MSAAPIIEVRGLARRFGPIQALGGIDLTVERGCVYGLLGENGAGKTTLVKHLLGQLRAKRGTVRLFGEDPVSDPAAVLSRTGYLAENQDLPGWMRLDAYLRFLEAFYPTWDRDLAASLCGQFGLDPSRKLGKLSKGQRARAALVGALAFRPDLLILDEPSSGLDPLARRDLLEAVIRSVVSDGRTVFFSSHLLEEVERIAERVAMLQAGRIVLDAPLDEILGDHHRLSLRFEEPQWRAPELPGALHCEGSGQNWTLLVHGDPGAWDALVAQRRAKVTGLRPAGLEEVFLGRARGSHP
ncbi:MAG: ABC transporter ATP-binding protein [Acidobacteriota bacterium]